MNLHILPDSKFSDAFYSNLREADLLKNNVAVVRTNLPVLKNVKEDIAFAGLYSKRFRSLTGDVSKYEKVFIHQLSPLMYRWIAKQQFRSLQWMSWGTDLYNLPFIDFNVYEQETLRFVQRQSTSIQNILYLLKVYALNMPFKSKAYASIDSVLTWMRSEFNFAKSHIPELRAKHSHFFYENQIPYEKIDSIISNCFVEERNKLQLVVGNSGTPTNNHLDAIQKIQKAGVPADLLIPVSYGEQKYVDHLKKSCSFYTMGQITFLDKFMDFENYLKLLHNSDGMVMNHIRPQGYGNIFMMMYMNKPVILNDKNISLDDLRSAKLTWATFGDLPHLRTSNFDENHDSVVRLLSHEKLISLYKALFSK